MATIIDGVLFVPAKNGTLVDRNNCTPDICSLDYAELRYVPSMAGNAIYLVIFFLLLAAQGYLGWRNKTRSFLTGMSIGIILEAIGYIGRLLLQADVFAFGPFVM